MCTTMDTVELDYDEYTDNDTRFDVCPIILIHGFTWSKYMFKELAQKLCKATNRKIFAIDLRNHGTSPETPNPCSYTFMADINRFMKDHELRRVSFVCHSFSNSFAYRIAEESPDSVEKLLMIDNPPYNDLTDEFNKTCVYPIIDIQNRTIQSLSPYMTLAKAQQKFHDLARAAGEKSRESFYKKVAYDLVKEGKMFKFRHDIDLLKQCVKEGHLNPPTGGTSDKEILIIRCENSLTVPDSKFETVKRDNPNARLMTFENTSHVLMFEVPDKLVQVAKDFFKTSD